jgi:BlaI family penicillinase repressor
VSVPRLTRLEYQIMEAMWVRGEVSVREILDSLSAKRKPAYTTIQTTVYRMEAKGIVRRVKKVGNVNVFAAAVSRGAAERRLIDELLAVFGGRSQPVTAHLVERGKLTLDDVKQAQETLHRLFKKEKRS